MNDLAVETLIAYGFTKLEKAIMDRVQEKLAQAAGVNVRVARSIEDDADALIAREEELLARKQAAFAPHHTALDARMKELDWFEDSLQVMENADPLAGTGDSDASKAALAAVEAELRNAGSSAPLTPSARASAAHGS